MRTDNTGFKFNAFDLRKQLRKFASTSYERLVNKIIANMEVVRNDTECHYERWDDPGEYPSGAGGSPLSSYNYVECDGACELRSWIATNDIDLATSLKEDGDLDEYVLYSRGKGDEIVEGHLKIALEEDDDLFGHQNSPLMKRPEVQPIADVGVNLKWKADINVHVDGDKAIMDIDVWWGAED